MFANQTPEVQNKLVDQATASADQAIRSTQRVANEALSGLAGSAQNLREHGGGAGSVLHEHGAQLNCPPRPRQAAIPAHHAPSAPSGPRCAYHPHGR